MTPRWRFIAGLLVMLAIISMLAWWLAGCPIRERLLRPTVIWPEGADILQMPPPLAAGFYGTVTYEDGSPAPWELPICFVGEENGLTYCCVGTFAYEDLTVYRANVPGDQEGTPEREGAVNGEILAIRLGGLATPYRVAWVSGTNSELNLVYEGGAPSTATSTATDTVTPTEVPTPTPTPSPTSTRWLPSPTPAQEPTSEPGGEQWYFPIVFKGGHYRQRYWILGAYPPPVVERTSGRIERVGQWLITPSISPLAMILAIIVAFYAGVAYLSLFVAAGREGAEKDGAKESDE